MSVCGGLEKPLILSYGVGGRALHRSQVGCEGLSCLRVGGDSDSDAPVRRCCGEKLRESSDQV